MYKVAFFLLFRCRRHFCKKLWLNRPWKLRCQASIASPIVLKLSLGNLLVRIFAPPWSSFFPYSIDYRIVDWLSKSMLKNSLKPHRVQYILKISNFKYRLGQKITKEQFLWSEFEGILCIYLYTVRKSFREFKKSVFIHK